MLKNKKNISIRTGTFKKIGAGINFFIDEIQFFSTLFKRHNLSKKILKFSYFDKEKEQRITSTLSGLKPVKGRENEYYFDLNHPAFRSKVNSQDNQIYYRLVEKENEIEIVKD